MLDDSPLLCQKKKKKEAISFVSCDIYRAGRGLVSSDGLEHACTHDLDVDGCCRIGIPRIERVWIMLYRLLDQATGSNAHFGSFMLIFVE